MKRKTITANDAVRLARLVEEWRKTPRDHGGNPWCQGFVRFADDIMQRSKSNTAKKAV